MIHYKVELKSVSDLVTDFPHSPQDQQASIQDYLEDNFANGWDLVAITGDTSRFVFRANGRNS